MLKLTAKRILREIIGVADSLTGKRVFGPKAPVSRQLWMMRLTGTSRPFEPPPKDGRIRINLGSGNNSLPGYINVDIVASRGEHQPDIISDLRELVFEDNYADEIMSIHVFEHFYLWDTPAVLKEWSRVLKPGGFLVLECPDILKCARNLIRDPLQVLNPEEGWKHAIYGLYGDPHWNDPLMIHRWGWTPASLSKALLDAGFIDVREEVAAFHRPVQRDMRVVGRKPLSS